MPWVYDEQAGWHYKRPKTKETSGTRRIIIEPNPPKPDTAAADGQPPALDVPGAVLGGEGADASSDAGSDPSAGGDGVDPGLRAGPLPEAGEGRSPDVAPEEQRPAEGNAPAPRKPRSAKQLANDQRLREAAAKRRLA